MICHELLLVVCFTHSTHLDIYRDIDDSTEVIFVLQIEIDEGPQQSFQVVLMKLVENQLGRRDVSRGSSKVSSQEPGMKVVHRNRQRFLSLVAFPVRVHSVTHGQLLKGQEYELGSQSCRFVQQLGRPSPHLSSLLGGVVSVRHRASGHQDLDQSQSVPQSCALNVLRLLLGGFAHVRIVRRWIDDSSKVCRRGCARSSE